MIRFEWNSAKNQLLKRERGISFEDVVFAINSGNLLDVVSHPNDVAYPNQSIYVVKANDYVYLIPFVTNEDETRFLKTIIPSRKATKRYLRRKQP